MSLKKRTDPSRETAETVAVGALAFLAAQPEALTRFLRLTGLTPQTLREAAGEPGFLAGLLDYFLANEALLMDYARDAGLPPGEIGRARAALDT